MSASSSAYAARRTKVRKCEASLQLIQAGILLLLRSHL